MKDDLGYPLTCVDRLKERIAELEAQLQEVKDAKAQMAGEFQQENLRLQTQIRQEREAHESLGQQTRQIDDEYEDCRAQVSQLQATISQLTESRDRWHRRANELEARVRGLEMKP